MIVGLVAVGMSILFNALALWVSWRIDRDGIPAALDGQAVRRKPGALKARLPNIGMNLVSQWIGALAAFWYFEDCFTMTWQGTGVVLAQLGIVLVLDDAWFYWMHRVLHRNRRLYRAIHKKHHEAFAPVPIEYCYVHPLEQSAGTVGIAVGVVLCLALFGQISVWTIWIFVGWRILHELEIHSGLRLPTRHLPLLAPMAHHDLHHAKPHKGNFASAFTVWDRLMGTRIEGDAAP
ncbi:MAG: sterol desaturase family protein [Myxococcales bacterium]|nr:sterol desaturase family protein [Myxococcales bacterium]